MKRRHRLAEVLLQHLPFDGNQHATACRLEHAIDDDLEVALTIYLNNPKIDPSGTTIPTMSQDIESRVNTSSEGFKNLNQLSQGESSTIKIIAAGISDLHFLNNLNIAVGSEIKSITDGSYQVADMTVQISKEIADRIII